VAFQPQGGAQALADHPIVFHKQQSHAASIASAVALDGPCGALHENWRVAGWRK
jgi:hypothetical protein